MARKVEVILELDDRGTVRVKQFAGETTKATARMSAAAERDFAKMSRAAGRHVDAMTDRFFRFARIAGPLLGVVAAGAVVKFGSEFESTMSLVQGVTGSTEQMMARLEGQARELGATTRYTANQAAAAMAELGKAGFETEEILKTMPDVLNLAAAGELEMAEAASITSDVIRSMGLEIKDFTKATDLMAKTATSSKTTIQELGYAYQDSAPLAKQLGVSFEHLNVLLGTLANRGFTATRAGTGLRRIFAVFLGDLEEGEEGLGKYNVQLVRGQDGTVDLAATFQQLVDAGMDANDVMTAFGLRGGPAALQIVDALGVDLPKMEEALKNSSGAAKELAEIRMKNLRGAGLELASAIQEDLLIVFDHLSENMTDSVRWATEVARSWGDLLKRSDVFEGINRLLKIGAGLATAYALAIGVGMARRLYSAADAAIRFSIGMDATNDSLVRGISRMTKLGELTAAQKAGFLGLAGAVGVVTYQLTRAILQTTGLDAAISDFFERAINRGADVNLTAGRLESTLELIGKNAEKLKATKIGDLGIEASPAVEDARQKLRILRGEASEYSNRAAADLRQQMITNAANVARPQEQLLDALTRLRKFAVSATEEQLDTWIGFWNDAAGEAESTAQRINIAFAAMEGKTAAEAKAAEDAAKRAREEAADLADAQVNLAKLLEGTAYATQQMGQALVDELQARLKDARLAGLDAQVVIESFKDEVLETVEAIKRAGQEVPPELEKIGEAMKGLQETEEWGMSLALDPVSEPVEIDWEEMLGEPELPELPWEEVIRPPETSEWEDFWTYLEDRSLESTELIGENFAMLAEMTISSFANMVGEVITGQESLGKAFSNLLKRMASAAISMLVQYAIQRLIVSKLSRKATASEASAEFSKGLASVYLNIFSSMAQAPWPVSLTAPIVAAAYMAIAAAGAGAAMGLGAGLGAGVGVAGGAEAGGLVRRRATIEVGENDNEEAILPLRGYHAQRVRRELGLDRLERAAGDVTISPTFIFSGDNWRATGIDDELSEQIYDGLERIIRLGRRPALPIGTEV